MSQGIRAWVVTGLLLAACGGARHESRSADRAAPREAPTRGAKAGIPPRGDRPGAPASPAALLGRDSVVKLQQALAGRGLLAQHREGELDRPTSAAVRRFQEKEGLAATGMPDRETLRRLGVDADEAHQTGGRGER